MNRILLSLVVLGMMLSTIEARADEPPMPHDLVMWPKRVALASPQFMDREVIVASASAVNPQALSDAELGLTTAPQFKRARGIRLAGVISSGVSLAAATALGALTIHFAQGPKDKEETGIVTTMYGVFTGISLGSAAAGIGLWIAGQHAMNTMREQRRNLLPQVSVAAGPGAAAIGARWQF